MGQLEKYGLYVMCLVIFLILGVTLWGEPANANKTRAKKEAAMHASLGDSTNSLQNASFDRDQNGSGPASRGSQGVASLLGPEDNPPPYQPVDDGDLPSVNLARKLVDDVRRRKGLRVEEKAVQHATKQRTLARKK